LYFIFRIKNLVVCWKTSHLTDMIDES